MALSSLVKDSNIMFVVARKCDKDAKYGSLEQCGRKTPLRTSMDGSLYKGPHKGSFLIHF